MRTMLGRALLALVLAFGLMLLPSSAGAEGTSTNWGKHLFIVADTSKSMAKTDPQRHAVLGALIVAELLEEGDQLTLVRLPDTKEICTRTGEMIDCGTSTSTERRYISANEQCHVCRREPDALRALAAGDRLTLEMNGGQVDAKAIRSHLRYVRNTTVFAPPLDTVANRVGKIKPPGSSYLLVMTDGHEDEEFKTQHYVWNRTTNNQFRMTQLVLVGSGATAPDNLDRQRQVLVTHTNELLQAIADLHAVSHQTTSQLITAQDGRLEVDVPEYATGVSIVVVANGRLSMQVPKSLNEARVTRGNNGHGLSYAIVQRDGGGDGTHHLSVRGRNAVALLMVEFDLDIALEVPSEAVTHQPFEVTPRVTGKSAAVVSRSGWRLQLHINHRPGTTVLPNEASQAEVLQPSQAQLYAKLDGPGRFVLTSPVYEIPTRAILDVGTVESGDRACATPHYVGRTCLTEVELPAGARVDTQSYSLPAMFDGPTTNCEGGNVCVDTDLWAHSAEVEIPGQVDNRPWQQREAWQKLGLGAKWHDELNEQGPLLVRFDVDRSLGLAHFAIFLPALVALVGWTLARRKRLNRTGLVAWVRDPQPDESGDVMQRWELMDLSELNRAGPPWERERVVLTESDGDHRPSVELEAMSTRCIRVHSIVPLSICHPGQQPQPAGKRADIAYGTVVRAGELLFAPLDADQVAALNDGTMKLPFVPHIDQADAPAAEERRLPTWLAIVWLLLIGATGMGLALFGPWTDGVVVFVASNIAMLAVGASTAALYRFITRRERAAQLASSDIDILRA